MTYKNKLFIIKNVLADKDRKSLLQILRDLLELNKKHSLNDMRYYFKTLMYKKDAGNIQMYVNDNVLTRILKFNSKQGKWHLLANKDVFIEKMKELPGSVPLYLGMIEEGFIYNKEGKIIAPSSKTNFSPILDKLIRIHKVIFIKKVLSFGGKGVFRYNETSTLNLDELDFQEDYLIEKGLVQHGTLNEINPYCVNTLRVISLNRNGEIKIPSCILRMGVNESHNDNASTGGIFVSYDLEKNKLGEVANKYIDKGGKSFYSHPRTHYIFKEKPLPYPDKIISLVTKAAMIFPERYIIGWDVAYTPEGPIIIEGNSNPCPIMTQISLRGLRNNKIYDDLYREFYN